jgi:hypothetical protein
MIRLAMQVADSTVRPNAWVCNLDRGLCIQKDRFYGVTHHSGLSLARPDYRYLDAVALQQQLLALPVDWTQPADVLRELWDAGALEVARIKELLATWDARYAAGD